MRQYHRATMSSLLPGIKVIGSLASLERRVKLHLGVDRVCSGAYERYAFVPSGQYRVPTKDELLYLVGEETKEREEDVCLIEMPARSQQELFRWRSRSRDLIREQHVEARDVGDKAMPDYVAEFAAKYAAGPISHQFLIYNNPGLRTTTVNAQTGRLTGLHIDSWHPGGSARSRSEVRRLCVNIGEGPRFLVFVNLPIQECAKAVQDAAGDGVGGSSTVHAFLSLFGEYPIVRLRINPGEGYIASTETTIHDASTLEGSSVDIAAMFLGSFHGRA